MKKLDIKLGGHHFTADDLLYMQSSLTEALKMFADMFGATAAIIYGVEFTITGGTTLNWTAGWVYINGEICQMDAGSATLASNNTLVIVETYDPAGNQVYEDLNTEDTYIIRKATVSGTAGGTNLYTNFKRFGMNALGDWSAISAIVNGNWGAIIPITTTAGYRKNQNSEVVLRGTISVSNFATPADDVAFTLPAGFRPAYGVTIQARATVNSVKTFVDLQIETDGTVSPQGLSASDDVQIQLYGISFPTI